MGRWAVAALAITLATLGCAEEPAPEPAAEPSGGGEAAAARSAADQPPIPFEMTARQERGKVIFESLCWTCHGMAGHGDGPTVAADSVPAPPDFHTTEIARLSVDQLLARFEGAFEGTDEVHPHMESVFAVVKPEAFQDAVTYIPALVHPVEIPGSAVAGQLEYQRLCQACHGATGDGDGAAAGTLLVRPANFQIDTLLANQDWQGAFDRVKQGQGVHGSSMPSWGRVIDDNAIWNLVAYIATFRPEYLSPPPGTSGTSGTSDTSDTSGTSDTSDTSGTPDTSDTSGTPGTPDMPATSDTSGGS